MRSNDRLGLNQDKLNNKNILPLHCNSVINLIAMRFWKKDSPEKSSGSEINFHNSHKKFG